MSSLSPNSEPPFDKNSRIGSGKTGYVYLTRLTDGREAILKRPPNDRVLNERKTAAEEIITEGRVLRSLADFSVNPLGGFTMRPVRLLSQGKDDASDPDQVYIVLEKVDGFHLQNILDYFNPNIKKEAIPADAAAMAESPKRLRILLAQAALALLEVLTRLHENSPAILWNDVRARHVYCNLAQNEFVLIDWGNSHFLTSDGRSEDRRHFASQDFDQYFEAFRELLCAAANDLYQEIAWPSGTVGDESRSDEINRLKDALKVVLLEEARQRERLRQELVNISDQKTTSGYAQLEKVKIIIDQLTQSGDSQTGALVKDACRQTITEMARQKDYRNLYRACRLAKELTGSQAWDLVYNIASLEESGGVIKEDFPKVTDLLAKGRWAEAHALLVKAAALTTSPLMTESLRNLSDQVRELHDPPISKKENLLEFVKAYFQAVQEKADEERRKAFEERSAFTEQQIQLFTVETNLKKEIDSWNRRDLPKGILPLDYNLDELMRLPEKIAIDSHLPMQWRDGVLRMASEARQAFLRKDYARAMELAYELLLYDPDRLRLLGAIETIKQEWDKQIQASRSAPVYSGYSRSEGGYPSTGPTNPAVRDQRSDRNTPGNEPTPKPAWRAPEPVNSWKEKKEEAATTQTPRQVEEQRQAREEPRNTQEESRRAQEEKPRGQEKPREGSEREFFAYLKDSRLELAEQEAGRLKNPDYARLVEQFSKILRSGPITKGAEVNPGRSQEMKEAVQVLALLAEWRALLSGSGIAEAKKYIQGKKIDRYKHWEAVRRAGKLHESWNRYEAFIHQLEKVETGKEVSREMANESTLEEGRSILLKLINAKTAFQRLNPADYQSLYGISNNVYEAMQQFKGIIYQLREVKPDSPLRLLAEARDWDAHLDRLNGASAVLTRLSTQRLAAPANDPGWQMITGFFNAYPPFLKPESPGWWEGALFPIMVVALTVAIIVGGWWLINLNQKGPNKQPTLTPSPEITSEPTSTPQNATAIPSNPQSDGQPGPELRASWDEWLASPPDGLPAQKTWLQEQLIQRARLPDPGVNWEDPAQVSQFEHWLRVTLAMCDLSGNTVGKEAYAALESYRPAHASKYGGEETIQAICGLDSASILRLVSQEPTSSVDWFGKNAALEIQCAQPEEAPSSGKEVVVGRQEPCSFSVKNAKIGLPSYLNLNVCARSLPKEDWYLSVTLHSGGSAATGVIGRKGTEPKSGIFQAVPDFRKIGGAAPEQWMPARELATCDQEPTRLEFRMAGNLVFFIENGDVKAEQMPAILRAEDKPPNLTLALWSASGKEASSLYISEMQFWYTGK